MPIPSTAAGPWREAPASLPDFGRRVLAFNTSTNRLFVARRKGTPARFVWECGGDVFVEPEFVDLWAAITLRD